MQSKPSPLSPLPTSRAAPSPRWRLAFDWRTALLRTFLPMAALLALPGLGIGALIWWRTSKTWDYRERWAGTWLLAIVGLAAYAVITWVARPLPALLHALLVDRQKRALVAGVRAVGELWLLHLCFAPACALILEWLHPLTRRARLSPRYRAPWRGQADGISPGQSPAVQPPPTEPLGTYLGGDLYEWLRGGQLCLPPEEMWRHGTVVGEPGYGKVRRMAA